MEKKGIGFSKVIAALSPKLRGTVIAEEEDNITIHSGAGIFRVPLSAIAQQKKTADNDVELTLNPGAKLIRETLVDSALATGALTDGIFGPIGGGIVARDCDCRCLCECRCDCDCRCLCDDKEFQVFMARASELAKFGQLNPKFGVPAMSRRG